MADLTAEDFKDPAKVAAAFGKKITPLADGRWPDETLGFIEIDSCPQSFSVGQLLRTDPAISLATIVTQGKVKETRPANSRGMA